jgi:hypothetical protein
MRQIFDAIEKGHSVNLLDYALQPHLSSMDANL